jgi:hypothetical protein
MFRVGQKVVCIRGTGARVPYRNQVVVGPMRGSVYTVRALQESDQGEEMLLLEELINPLFVDGLEFDFSADRFRPVVERKTDITVFTEILHKASRKQEVRA